MTRVASGFTLIELMVTIAVLAILLAIAVPSFNEASLNGKLNSMSSSFVASAQLARSEAIKRNAAVTLCASSNGTSCSGTWNDGWIVLAGGSPVLAQGPMTTGFSLTATGNATSLMFQPSGMGATSTTLTLCRKTPSIGSLQRTITISATGRPSITKVNGATTCS